MSTDVEREGKKATLPNCIYSIINKEVNNDIGNETKRGDGLIGIEKKIQFDLWSYKWLI
jgi:hypothetical protein